MTKTAYYLERVGAAQEIEGGLIIRARIAWSLLSDWASICQLRIRLNVLDFSFDDLT